MSKSFIVKLTVEVTRHVIADSAEEAIDNVDYNDMMREIKNYSISGDLSAEEVAL